MARGRKKAHCIYQYSFRKQVISLLKAKAQQLIAFSNSIWHKTV